MRLQLCQMNMQLCQINMWSCQMNMRLCQINMWLCQINMPLLKCQRILISRDFKNIAHVPEFCIWNILPGNNRIIKRFFFEFISRFRATYLHLAVNFTVLNCCALNLLRWLSYTDFWNQIIYICTIFFLIIRWSLRQNYHALILRFVFYYAQIFHTELLCADDRFFF